MINPEAIEYFTKLTTPNVQIVPLADASLCIINSNLFSNDPVIVVPSSRRMPLCAPIGDGNKQFIIDNIRCYETVPTVSTVSAINPLGAKVDMSPTIDPLGAKVDTSIAKVDLSTIRPKFYGPITGEASLYLDGRAIKYRIYGFCLDDTIVGKLCFVSASQSSDERNYYEYTYQIIDHAGTSLSLPTSLSIKQIARPAHKLIRQYVDINRRPPHLWKCHMFHYNLSSQLIHEITPIIIDNTEYYRECRYHAAANPNPIAKAILASDRTDLHAYLQIHRNIVNKLNLISLYHYKLAGNDLAKHFCCVDYTSIVLAVMYQDGNIVNKLLWTTAV